MLRCNNFVPEAECRSRDYCLEGASDHGLQIHTTLYAMTFIKQRDLVAISAYDNCGGNAKVHEDASF